MRSSRAFTNPIFKTIAHNLTLPVRVRQFGLLLLKRGETDEAETHLLRGLEIVQELVGSESSHESLQHVVASFHEALADLYFQSKNWNDAEIQAKKNLNTRREMADRSTDEATQRHLAAALIQLGIVQFKNGKPSESDHQFQSSWEILNRLAQSNAGSYETQQYLFQWNSFAGQVSLESDELAEAEKHFRASLEIVKNIAEDRPLDSTILTGLYVAERNILECKRRLVEKNPHDSQCQT